VVHPSEDTTFESSIIRARLNRDVADPKVYYYLWRSPVGRALMASIATRTAVSGITGSNLVQLKVPLPPLPTQRKIAAVLSAYDDLIENNTRRIEILEEMARAIYREWFVNFRFPGHEKVRMVDSPLGTMPEGWEVVKLSDVCQIVMRQSPKSEFYNDKGESLPFHQGVTDFGRRFPTDRMYCTVENRIAEAGDILFSVRAPVGRINLTTKRMVIRRGLAAIRSTTGHQAFIFQHLKERFQEEEDSIGGGTIFKAVTKSDMHGLKILQPEKMLVQWFESVVQPMFSELENLTSKNDNLQCTRDLLLPKLISGEVDVEDMVISIGGN
jgi:type I restriction enzyme, S subunit